MLSILTKKLGKNGKITDVSDKEKDYIYKILKYYREDNTKFAILAYKDIKDEVDFDSVKEDELVSDMVLIGIVGITINYD